MSLWWVFAFLFAERLFELRVAAKNRLILLQRGGREFFPESYRGIVLMHLLFLASLILESYPWSVPVDERTLIVLCCVLLLQIARYWCVWSLKEHWNTRIILVPGAAISRRGPYKFMRHPNYLVVTLEFVLLPLLARAPVTLLVFSVANFFMLRRRIFYEEQALREHTDYSRHFGQN
jgi:methyltransferase